MMVLAASMSIPKGDHDRDADRIKYLASVPSIYEDSTPNVFDPSSFNGTEQSKWDSVRNSLSECVPRLKAFACTFAIAVGLNNVFRFPREVSHYGGLPFLVAHLLLTGCISLPLVFLEVGLGQFCERGVTKLWRAVPAFRGLAYIKLSMAFICATYTFIYMSLSTSFLLRVAKGPVPLEECRELRIGETGYKVNATDGLECVRKTMLAPVLENPTNYGINASIIFVLWLSLSACLYKKAKSFRVAVITMAFGVVVCAIVVAIFNGISEDIGPLFKNTDWYHLISPGLWHSALIQSFFSLHLGLGYMVTSSSTIYNNRNPITTSIAYVSTHLLVGWVSVLFWYKQITDNSETSIIDTMLVVYDSAIGSNGSVIGTCFSFALFVLAGCITILALLFPIYNSIWVDIMSTWKILTVVSLSISTGIIISLMIFTQGIDIMILLDEYVLPALLTFVIFMETFSFTFIYDHKNVYNVIEFLVGNSISCLWKMLWCMTPFVVLGLAVWRVWGYTLNEWHWQYEEWHLWLTAGILIAAFVVFVATAIWVISRQVDYNCIQRIASSFKASHRWGPADPIRRYGWLQWTSSESKDFTLKRKGTIDYTNSARIAGYNRRVQKRRRTSNDSEDNYGVYITNNRNDSNNRHHILDVVGRSPHLQTAVITRNINNNNLNNEIPTNPANWVYFREPQNRPNENLSRVGNGKAKKDEDITKF